MMAVIGNNTLYFDQTSPGQAANGNTPATQPTYTERFFGNESLTYDGSQYTLTDSTGDQFVFNDFTVSNPVWWLTIL